MPNKPKKPRLFVIDRAGELREISRNNTNPTLCVRNCKGIYREQKKMYCNYCNDMLPTMGNHIIRSTRCREQTVSELCEKECRCKSCKTVLDCCIFDENFCKYESNLLCKKYNEV